MRICLIGGIFGKPADYRAVVALSPEIVLAEGLRSRGHTVVELGHRGPFRFDGFDVVHAHHLAAGTLAAAARQSVRLAFTPHWLTQQSASRRLAMRYVMARADAIVPLSETEARWQREHFPGLASRQFAIPNGIDETIFRYTPPPPPPAAGEPWRLLYVGQLARFKGVEYLLRAIARLSLENVVLDLVYQVDTDESRLRQEANELGLRSVRFLGPRSPVELAEIYARAHLLVLPSTAEALPSVVSEALLVGRPVVATDVGAAREQVADFGVVVEPRDEAALAGAISAVIGDYGRYMSASRRASADALERYSVRAMILAHERMYEQLLARPARRRSGLQKLLDAQLRRVTALRHDRQGQVGAC